MKRQGNGGADERARKGRCHPEFFELHFIFLHFPFTLLPPSDRGLVYVGRKGRKENGKERKMK